MPLSYKRQISLLSNCLFPKALRGVPLCEGATLTDAGVAVASAAEIEEVEVGVEID